MTTANTETSTDAQFATHNRHQFGATPVHGSRDRLIRIETDRGEWKYVPAFPDVSPARTTFYDPTAHGMPSRLWKLQHNRGHTWDGRGKTTAREDYRIRRCRAILQQCEIPKWAESVAVNRVSRENLNSFSGHYKGADGACLGFAVLVMFDDSQEAKGSYVADRAPSIIPGLNHDDVQNLIEYVFQSYGGED